MKRPIHLAALLGVLAVCFWISPVQSTGAGTGPGLADTEIQALTAEYAKAFNAGDAKSAAMLWTAEGEYIAADGEVTRGRPAIEKSLAKYFKDNPKAKVTVRVESTTPMARGLVSAEGIVTLKLTPDAEPTESRYTALHVHEDNGWRAASVREWVPDPATAVTPEHLDWLIGDWTSSGPGGELTITYTWDEAKKFITGTYTLARDGKTLSSGKQVIGKNPSGGLRSWLFDSTGTTSDGVWYREESRWINEAWGVLPEGSEVYSVNVLIPLGNDAFTWQTTDREIDGVAVEPLPPIKVTRVKN